MKYIIKGLGRLVLIALLSPVIILVGVPLFFVDVIYVLGGKDPFETPTRKLLERIMGIILREFSL